MKEDRPVELSPVVNALGSWRNKDFVGVRFNSTSPRFTATVALENPSYQKAAAALLGLFRELAAVRQPSSTNNNLLKVTLIVV